MLSKGLLRFGTGLGLAVYVMAHLLALILFALMEPPGSVLAPGVAGLAYLVLLLVGCPASVAVHECGHLLACLAFKVKVREFRIGWPHRAAYVFTVRGVTVALGNPFTGRVTYDPVASRWREAVVLISGSLANLAVAGVLLALGLVTTPALSGAVQVPVHQAIEVALAALFAAGGIFNLLPLQVRPLRVRWGRLSDGAQLLMLGSGRLTQAMRQDEILPGRKGALWRPANAEEIAGYELDSAALERLYQDPGAKLPPELTDKWLAAFRDRTYIGLATAWAVGRTLRMEGRVAELLQLLEDYPVSSRRHGPQMILSMSSVAYEVALLPDMPPRVMKMVVDRLQRAISAFNATAARNDQVTRAALLHSMAVAQLRRGNPGAVEALCQKGLASTELSPGNRATVLATVALARRALGQPYETLLAEAVALDPEADLVAEASRRSAAAGT